MIRNVRLNDVVKKVGSTIIANPSEETTDVLKKVNIDGVIYEIQGGGSGEGLVSVDKEMTYAENDFGFDVVAPFTEEEFTKLYGEKCDLYLFIRQDDGEGTFIMQGFSFNKLLTQDVNGELTVAYYLDMDTTNRVGLVISLSNGVIQHEFSIEGDTGARFIQLSATAEDWSDLTIENGAIESMYQNLAAMVEVGSNEYYSTNITIDNTTAVIDFILTPTRHRIVTLTRPSEYEDFDTIANVAEEITLVEANSGEETTETLTTLKVGHTNYALGSGGSEIVDINDLSVIPTDYQDIEKLKNVILFKNDLYYELTYADSDYLYYTNTYELAYNRISVSLIDYSINQAETINVDRVFGVEITDVPSTATNGTLTEEQLATLQASDSNYILFNNEKYYLNDKGHTEGYLTYSHLGAASEEIIAKTITITISTRAWVLLEEQVGGGSGIVELEELPSVVDESSPNLVIVDNVLYIKKKIQPDTYWLFNDTLTSLPPRRFFINYYYINNGTPTTRGWINYSGSAMTFNNTTVYSNGVWSNEYYKTIYITGGEDVENEEFLTWISQNATKITPASYYEYVKESKPIMLDVTSWGSSVPTQFRDIELLKSAILFSKQSNSTLINYYSFVEESSIETPSHKLKFKSLSNFGFSANPYNKEEYLFYYEIEINVYSWSLTLRQNQDTKILSFNKTTKPTYKLDNLVFANTRDIYQVAAQGVDFNTLLSITAEATSGTITSDMLEVLQLSEENYIVFNNQIYRLQDNENDSGILTYTYVGHSAEIVSKTITITISTLAWTLSTVSITAEITGALEGDY